MAFLLVIFCWVLDCLVVSTYNWSADACRVKVLIFGADAVIYQCIV